MGLFFGPLGNFFLESWFPDFQTPPPADEFSDPNLTPLPTHPGIKYVARALAAMLFVDFFSGLRQALSEITPNGAGRFVFLLIRTLPAFWATRI